MVRILTSGADESKAKAGALVIPLYEGEGIAKHKPLDMALGGSLRKILKSEFKGKPLETCLVHTHGSLGAERLLFLGLGKKKEITPEKIRQTGGKALTALKSSGAKDAALSTAFAGKNIRNIVHFAEGAYLADYDFNEYKKSNNNHKELKTLTLLTTARLDKELASAKAVSEAVHYARGLVNTPSNDLRPSGLASEAKKIKGLSVRIIEKKEAERLGMGAYLAVAKGSAEPPKFIILTYKGPKAKSKSPVVLIGKSVTFDSGGISLKPADGMEKMKYDMAGGAAVLGALKACASLRLPINAIGILPAVENLPGGTATRPGDIVKSITGKTIEIINTDAEGRLILADALGYSKRFKPSAVVNIATLTGACSVALGNEAVALMGNDEKVIGRIKKASEATGERVWEMPLYEEYGEYIKSDSADIRNTSSIRSGSLVTAGYFLKEFAEGLKWAHLDIASTAWNDKPRPYSPKGASGIGVRLLLEFLRLGIK